MKIAYSALTDKIYLTNSKGKQEDVTQNFLQVMLLWFHETSPLMKQGDKWERSLRKAGTDQVEWVFTIEKK
jgi:hypothetical protein